MFEGTGSSGWGTEATSARHRDVIGSQTKTRERVRALAEVYTNASEVNAMLDLVADMFPSSEDPREIGRTFLEPTCGSGNFLVEILGRKLSFVCRPYFKSITTIEAAALKALSSIYGIDIDQSNIDASRHFLRVEIEHHMNMVLNTEPVTAGFMGAVDTILSTNIICADTINSAPEIQLVAYHWKGKPGHLTREWSFLEEPSNQLSLFEGGIELAQRDSASIHYSKLAENPNPVA